MNQRTVRLNNGVLMPTLGLGMYKILRSEDVNLVVKEAWNAGYRSFDTAQMYQNEAELGQALQMYSIPREKVFITSKLDIKNMDPKKVKPSLEESLKKLRIKTLDLFLIHWPGQKKDRLISVWREMETLYRDKKVRAIGVCNCCKKHLDWIENNASIVPAVNQVERHPLQAQNALTSYCREKAVQPEAWAPLNRGNFDLPGLKELSKKYHKTPAQILLRWNLQTGYVVIPKSTHKERIWENAAIYDFSLSEEDIRLLSQFDLGKNTSHDPELYDY